jgi:hypothetical protein
MLKRQAGRRIRLDQAVLNQRLEGAVADDRIAGYPTLLDRNHFDECVLCQWKDGGQDDYEAAKVCGGPNEDYSLEEARMNFEEHLTKYRPSDETWPDTKVYFVPEIQNAKRYLMAAYDRLIVEIEEGKEALIWMEIDEREKELLRTIGKIAK